MDSELKKKSSARFQTADELRRKNINWLLAYWNEKLKDSHREKEKKPRKRADKKTRKEWAMAERVTKMKYQCRKADVATRRPYQIKERRLKR